MNTFFLIGEDPTRTRKNSTESNVLTTADGDVMYQKCPPNGVVGFGQEGGDHNNFDLNQVAAVTNNNFQTFVCDNGRN